MTQTILTHEEINLHLERTIGFDRILDVFFHVVLYCTELHSIINRCIPLIQIHEFIEQKDEYGASTAMAYVGLREIKTWSLMLCKLHTTLKPECSKFTGLDDVVIECIGHDQIYKIVAEYTRMLSYATRLLTENKITANEIRSKCPDRIEVYSDIVNYLNGFVCKTELLI